MSELPDSTAAFLERVPNGLDSYPDHVVKMSVVRTWIDGHDLAKLIERIPAVLEPEALLSRPVTSWIPEVHATVVYLAVREAFFEDDDAYVTAAFAKNAALLRSPLYRVLTSLFSWRRISSMGNEVFRRLHRGLDSTIEVVEDRGLSWVLSYPPHLVPPLVGRCYATVLATALQAGGLPNPRVDIESLSETRLRSTVLRS